MPHPGDPDEDRNDFRPQGPLLLWPEQLTRDKPSPHKSFSTPIPPRSPAGTWSNETGQGTIFTCMLCKAGTFNAKLGQTSREACRPCTQGSFCTQGADQPTGCGPGLDTLAQGAASRSDCGTLPALSRSWPPSHRPCPCVLGTMLLFLRNMSWDRGLLAVCESGFFDLEVDPIECHRCLPGANCSRAGATLRALNIDMGFWRFNSTSLIVHECDVLPSSTPYACVGGTIWAQSCAEHHHGPFCDLVRNRIGTPRPWLRMCDHIRLQPVEGHDYARVLVRPSATRASKRTGVWARAMHGVRCHHVRGLWAGHLSGLRTCAHGQCHALTAINPSTQHSG